MAQTLTPLTELMAVNAMLSAIGEAPVSTITGSGLEDVAQAVAELERVSREVQQKGWWFNTECDYPIVPTSNQIVFPSNALAADPTDQSKEYVWRAGKFYDLEDRTFTITDTIKVNVTWMYNFEDLPPVVRNYITAKAKEEFQQSILGSDAVDKRIKEDVGRAWVQMMRANNKRSNLNFNNNVHGRNILGRRLR